MNMWVAPGLPYFVAPAPSVHRCLIDIMDDVAILNVLDQLISELLLLVDPALQVCGGPRETHASVADVEKPITPSERLLRNGNAVTLSDELHSMTQPETRPCSQAIARGDLRDDLGPQLARLTNRL